MSSTFKNPLNFYLYPLGSNNLFTQSYINWWRTDFFTILNCKVDLSCLKKVRKHTWSQDTRGWTSMACPGGCDHQGWGSEEVRSLLSVPRLGRARPPADLSAWGSPGERQWHVWRGQETWFLVPSPKVPSSSEILLISASWGVRHGGARRYPFNPSCTMLHQTSACCSLVPHSYRKSREGRNGIVPVYRRV